MARASMATVLVVDDRVTNRNILTRLAQSVEEGVQVHAFPGARDALRYLDDHPPPDLVITDYNMPEMDGATFITMLRSRPGLEDVPIIVVTVYEDRDYCYRALEAGATDFLLSPVDHVEFRARARNLLTLRRQQRLLRERTAELEQALRERPGSFLGPEARFREILEAVPAPLSVVDEHGRLVYVNRSYAALVDQEPEHLIGRDLEEVHGEAFATRHAVLNERILQAGIVLSQPRREVIDANSGTRTLLTVKAPVGNPLVSRRRVVSLMLDVTELDRREQQQERTGRDSVTGLPGAELIRDHLASEIGRARRLGQMVALHLLDIDRFKGINDAFSEAFGDALLAAIADRLQQHLRETDYLGRWRSDEFVVVQTGVRRADDAAELCHRLSEAFATPFSISGQEIHMSASIGITLFPGDAKTPETLFKNAELAMYRAKHGGRDTYRFFAQEMNIAARRAVALERELRQALAADQFVVYYQPQWSLRHDRLVGIEALVRWNHPRRGIVAPGEFIGLAEEIGLIAPLTAWVLRTACEQHRAWLDDGLEDVVLSVNFSPVQFRERGVEYMVERVLEDTGLPPSALEIELVENAVVDDNPAAAASLRYLQKLGVSLAIDDFGTRYSSLSYLQRLPVQRLKIDRSFVLGLGGSESNDTTIVRAIISLGRSLGLRVIAEGVETESQRDELLALGCEEIQGHLVAPPLRAEEFRARFVGRRLAPALE